MNQHEPVESTPKRFFSSSEDDHESRCHYSSSSFKEHWQCHGLWLRMFRPLCEGRGKENIDWKTISSEVPSPLLSAFYVDAKSQEERHAGLFSRTCRVLRLTDGVLKQRKKDSLERQVQHKALVTKDDVVFFIVDGKEILKLGPSCMSKNHQGGLQVTSVILKKKEFIYQFIHQFIPGRHSGLVKDHD